MLGAMVPRIRKLIAASLDDEAIPLQLATKLCHPVYLASACGTASSVSVWCSPLASVRA
jgi:hypothetical protein